MEDWGMPVMQLNDIKCALSEAYLLALAASMGRACEITNRYVDSLGIDANIFVEEAFGDNPQRSDFTTSIQLKATSDAPKWNKKTKRWGFKIDVKLYDKYRSIKSGNLLFIIILILPK